MRFEAPIDFLFAHGLELVLKGCLRMTSKPDLEVGNYQHDLDRAYWDLKRIWPAATNLAESKVRKYWKDKLRTMNAGHVASLESFGISDKNDLAEFRAVTNSDIGQSLPELGKVISWYSQLHNRSGSSFRYLKVGLVSRPALKIAGETLDATRESLSVGVQSLISTVESEARNG